MKKSRKWRIAVSIVVSILEAISIGALVYAIREMNHEGLTYSQWYEGSIYGFYSCLLKTVAISFLFLVSWISLFRRREKENVKKMAERKKLFVSFAIVTTVFIILSMARYRAIEAASRENVECLEPYIRRYGNSLVLALLSFEAALASLIIVPQKIVNFRQRSEWKKEVMTDRVEDR